jgi:uncharacterized alkaline shock family protein YloU
MPENRGYIVSSDEKGSINICRSVVAVIATSTAMEVDGVHGLHPLHGKDITQSAMHRGLSKGVKISIAKENITIDVNIIAEIGSAVREVAETVQKAIKAAIEEAVGISVNSVNVIVSGVSLKKAKTPVK